MQHPPYELLVPRNAEGQLKKLGRFNSHIMRPSNKSGSSSTQTGDDTVENVQDTCEFPHLP